MSFKFGVINEAVKCHYGFRGVGANVSGPGDDELFRDENISLITGKRDWAAFQVVIKSDEDYNLSVGSRAVFSPKGIMDNIRLSAKVDGLVKAKVRMNIVGYIDDDNGIYKTDILLNDDAILGLKNRNQPVWVEIAIPEDAEPGIYNGTVDIFSQRMFEDERKIKTLTFQLEVKDVLLGKPEDNKFHLDLWQHLSNIARKHEVKLWSEEHFQVIESYVKTLGELGQKAITIIASEVPWSGQGCVNVDNYPSDLFEYNYVRIDRDKQGNYIYDFSVVERYIELCFKYGIKEEIEVLGLVSIWRDENIGFGKVVQGYADAIRIRYFNSEDGSYKYMRELKDITKYIKALEEFFIDKGWIDIVRIAADEPADSAVYNEALSTIKSVATNFKFKTAINHVEFIEDSKETVEDFVPVLPVICEKWNEIQEVKKHIKGRLYWYVCCWPNYPNTFIESPLLESRLIGLLTSYLNLDGFLRWNYTVWPENPRERISYKYPIWIAGDTNFVYPAKNGTPLLSLRYKNLKRGIEEFELLERVKENAERELNKVNIGTVNANNEQKELKENNIILEENKEQSRSSSQVIQKIWDKLLKEKDITKYYEKESTPDKLYSLNYEDYEQVRRWMLEELEGNR